MTRSDIEREAVKLLLMQNSAGRYSLSFLDMRSIVTGGRALVGSISDYEKRTGERLSPRPEGLTVISGGISLVLYDERQRNLKRLNWTIAHELGHIFLSHEKDGKSEQSEADRFAAELLMPEAVIRFLDCSLGKELSPSEMTKYFPSSFSACKRRRMELSCRKYSFSEEGNELINRLFSLPQPLESSIELDYIKSAL